MTCVATTIKQIKVFIAIINPIILANIKNDKNKKLVLKITFFQLSIIYVWKFPRFYRVLYSEKEFFFAENYECE